MSLFTDEKAKELSEKINALLEAAQVDNVKLGYQMTVVELDKTNPQAALFSNVAKQVAFSIASATVNVIGAQLTPVDPSAQTAVQDG